MWKSSCKLATVLMLLSFAFSSIAFVSSIEHWSEVTTYHNKSRQASNYKMFEATSEWQPFADDERLPRGLHIRVNLQTRKKEAKLYDAKVEQTGLAAVPVDETQPPEPTKGDAVENLISSEEMKRSLHRMGFDEPEPTPQDIDRVKKNFRSYKELKKDFDSLKMAVKTDMEIISELVEEYRKLMKRKNEASVDDEEHRMLILIDLEYLVHQIDNAKDFALSGGLNELVLPSLNASSERVRSVAARLLGSAVQSNSGAQIAALEAGALNIILRTLATDTAPSVRSGALYALSCLTRRFPIAQAKMIEDGGLDVLSQIFDRNSNEDLKLQVKVVTFIDDLVVERREAEKTAADLLSLTAGNNNNASLAHDASERLRQYNAVGLETKLQQHGWCRHLNSLLLKQCKIGSDENNQESTAVEAEDDIIDKIISAMLSLSELCTQTFDNPYTKNVLLSLLRWYSELSSHDHDEPYYSMLHKQVVSLSRKLNHLTHHAKDEL